MRTAAIAILVGATFLLSGCQYLFGMTPQIPPIGGSFDPGVFPSFDPSDFGSFDPSDPGFSLPPPLATYTTGTATVKIAGATTTLGKLSALGTSYADFGTEVGWTDGKGLYVHFYGTTAPGEATSDGFLTIDRIQDGQHWATADPEVCAVTVTQNDVKGLVGTSSCKGLQWADTMGTSSGAGPALVVGEPAFDAEVTFKAAP